MNPTTPQDPEDGRNPFAENRGRLRVKERIQRSALFGATLTVLIVAVVIFGTIAARGLPVLWKFGSTFLTESPETLVVFKINPGETLSLPPEGFETLERSNPDVAFQNVSDSTVPVPQNSFVLGKGLHPMAASVARELEEAAGERVGAQGAPDGVREEGGRGEVEVRLVAIEGSLVGRVREPLAEVGHPLGLPAAANFERG
jgi:hypothetical protein